MRAFFALVLVLIGCSPALAQSSRIERHGAFILLGGQSEVAILAGDLTAQTPLEFKTVLNRQPNLKTLVLSSDGGSVVGGLLLADEIYLRGINTYIPEGFGCHSACSYVFLAGAARLVDGDLGVHQFYGGEESAAAAQFVVSDILDILAKFDTPQSVISRMLRTPSYDMYIFTQDEVAAAGINRNPQQLKTAVTTVSQLPEPVLVAMTPMPFETATTADSTTTNPGEAPGDGPGDGERFAIYDGIDFYGADLAKIRTDDLAQCFAACFENQQCLALTMNVNPAVASGPNCFLKDGWGEIEFYEHAISGAFLARDFDGVLVVGDQDVPPTTIVE